MRKRTKLLMQRFMEFCLGQEGLWAFLFMMFVGQMIGQVTLPAPLRLLTTLFFTLFLVAGVFNLSTHIGVRILASLVVLAAIVLRWLRLLYPSPEVIGWGLAASLLFMVFLTVASIDKVFRDDRPVTSSRVRGAVAVYLLFGLTWSYLYGLIDLLIPGSFNFPAHEDLSELSRQDSFTYFSFVTLATLGYGDITPAHPLARMFAVIQALFGQLYPATLLARLVSLEITTRQEAAKVSRETETP